MHVIELELRARKALNFVGDAADVEGPQYRPLFLAVSRALLGLNTARQERGNSTYVDWIQSTLASVESAQAAAEGMSVAGAHLRTAHGSLTEAMRLTEQKETANELLEGIRRGSRDVAEWIRREGDQPWMPEMLAYFVEDVQELDKLLEAKGPLPNAWRRP